MPVCEYNGGKSGGRYASREPWNCAVKTGRTGYEGVEDDTPRTQS